MKKAIIAPGQIVEWIKYGIIIYILLFVFKEVIQALK